MKFSNWFVFVPRFLISSDNKFRIFCFSRGTIKLKRKIITIKFRELIEVITLNQIILNQKRKKNSNSSRRNHEDDKKEANMRSP